MSVLNNSCPQCGRGKVFKGLVSMNKTCPECGFNFYPEDGFYTGAMYLMVMALTMSMVPFILIAAAFGTPALIRAGVFVCLMMVFLSPFYFRFARLLWLYASAPKRKPGQ